MSEPLRVWVARGLDESGKPWEEVCTTFLGACAFAERAESSQFRHVHVCDAVAIPLSEYEAMRRELEAGRKLKSLLGAADLRACCSRCTYCYGFDDNVIEAMREFEVGGGG